MPDLTGIGLYTLPEASRLTRAPAREIRRWLFGYTFKAKSGDHRRSAPLWPVQLRQLDADLDQHIIGFRDLLELRFVQAFVRHGVNLIVVRACWSTAKQMFGSDYPFTNQRFLTDKRTIYHEVRNDPQHSDLLDLKTKQFAIEDIIRPSLHKGIDFNEHGDAVRWWPATTRAVVIDPSIAFGKPVLAEHGVPTAAIYASMKAEGNRGLVAKMFDIPVAAVDAAVRYEERLAA
jgi:uncharacterized protein (DUF433 family)